VERFVELSRLVESSSAAELSRQVVWSSGV